MEQIVVLILFFLLPTLIKRLNKQQKKGGAAKKPRPARAQAPRRERDPGPVAKPAQEELPEWLQEMAERLGGGESPAPVPEPEPAYEPEPEPILVERSVTPGRDWERLSEPVTPWLGPEIPLRAVSRPLKVKVPPRRALHGGLRSRDYVPRDRKAWQRAVVMAEVLGQPRALAPFREPGTKPEPTA